MRDVKIRTGRLAFAALLSACSTLLAAAPTQASNAAAGPARTLLAPSGVPLDLTIDSLDAVGCESSDTHLSFTAAGLSGNEYVRTRVTAGGARYMDQIFGPINNPAQIWYLFDDNSGGTVTAPFPLPPNTPVTVDLEFVGATGTPVLFHRQFVISQCNGGTIQDDRRVPEWDVVALENIGCGNNDTAFTLVVSGTEGADLRLRTIVDAGGDRYMDEEIESPATNGYWFWQLYDDSSGGPVTASFPLPEDTPIHVRLVLLDGEQGPIRYDRDIVLDKCNGGTIVSNTVRPKWHVHSLYSVGCDASAIGFVTSLTGYQGGPERFRTTVDAGGVRYMDEDAGTPGSGNGTYYWNLYDSGSGGPVGANFPLPPDTPIRVGFHLIQGSYGPDLFLREVVIAQCNGGSIVGDQDFDVASDRIFYDGIDVLPPLLH